MRVITDELFTKLVKILLQDEKVTIYQQLILSQKAEPTDNADEIKTNGGE